MADLLPTSPEATTAEKADPRVIGVDSDDADDLLGALSSPTARSVLSALHDDPGTPSAVADRVDISLQNTQYHLGNLESAGLIEVVDTVYSEKGREMNVYAPADRPLVVFAGSSDESGDIESALARLLGAVAVLGVVSVFIQYLFGADGVFNGPRPGITGDGVRTAADTIATGIAPGALFFAGGAVVLLIGFATWYRQRS